MAKTELAQIIAASLASNLATRMGADWLSQLNIIHPIAAQAILWSSILIPLYIFNTHHLRQRVHRDDREKTVRSSLVRDCLSLTIALLHPALASGILGAKIYIAGELDSVTLAKQPHSSKYNPNQTLLH